MNTPAMPGRQRIMAALFLLGCLALGVLFCKIEYNPSFGARIDFTRFHYPTIEQFRTLDFFAFLREMNTASGPLYYALMGSTPMGPDSIRISTLLLHVMSTGLVWWLAYRRLGATAWPWLLAGAFYFSPFQLGPALWGHPETLATLLVFLALWLHTQGFVATASVLSALSVTSRQTAIAILGGLGLWDLQQGRFKNLALKMALAGAMLLALVYHWHGLTPPKFQDHMAVSGRTFLVSMAMMGLALFNWKLLPTRTSWRPLLLVWLILLPVCLIAYNASIHFDRGGFIFSILDKMDAQRWGWCLSSPVILSGILALCVPPLREDPMTALTLLGLSATLAISNVFYIKYVDFYIWPLALSMFAFAAHQDARLITLTKSLAAWSVVNLALVSLRY
ncbi:MAG: hypothetical protein Q7V20_13850 [Aquabacterium sp.]|uniref:hypothetical protein n=1 Tax=Aquabacterium sp. TaxID=1872578 RepID=UPI002719A20E|nr:hypothetical protein [Aquabacterium sp.]MDO9004527.1 hypothetical protein [Aquabacterium sp.]